MAEVQNQSLNVDALAAGEGAAWVRTHKGPILEVWMRDRYTAIPVPEDVELSLEAAREVAPEAEYLRINVRGTFGSWVVVAVGKGLAHKEGVE
jgi:chloramphenicol 3-O-phosphotransferase